MTTRRSLCLCFTLLAIGCGPATRVSMFDTGARDGGVDAAALADTGVDAASGSDGGFDAGSDAGAAVDAAADDSGLDAGVDAASSDAGSDAGRDASAPDAGPVDVGHLVFSEVSVTPNGAEFFEIWNPTGSTISLADVYVSDNSIYTAIASGGAWAPSTSTPGTDFVGGFPAGTTLAAGAVIVVSTDAGFETTYGRCPNYIAGPAAVTCGSSSVPTLRSVVAGALDGEAGLSNEREMLVLFTWDGVAGHLVRDLDYVTWGATSEIPSRVDKTGLSTYLPDTARASQHPAPVPAMGQSITRCGTETGETTTGGNGIGGHDETSERLDMSFRTTTTPTPGVRAACP